MCSYERIHERVLRRLKGDEEVAYLNALFDFFAAPPTDARAQALEYIDRVQYFLTTEERLALPALPHHVKGGPLCTVACSHCGQSAWELDETRGERVCVCGRVDVCGTVSKKYWPFDRKMPTTHAYRRSTHFTATLQALLTQRPPAHIVEPVRAEAKRQRANLALLTHERVRELMRTVGLKAHYNLAPSILAHLKGEKLPRLSIVDIDRLHVLFDEVQVAFDRTIHSIDRMRHNFISYPHLLKMCLIRIERGDLAAHLPEMKTREKRRHQEEIWGCIATCLGFKEMAPIQK